MAPSALRTRVYVDGYNFYYGCLKGTCYKWLDLFQLFSQQVLPSILVQRAGVPCSPYLGGQTPISLMTTEAGLRQVIAYMRTWTADRSRCLGGPD